MKKILICALVFASMASYAQPKNGKKEEPKKPETAYTFTDVKIVPQTSVKNQASSGTCWSFSGTGFLESELLAQGKGEYDLSEMWIVRHTYFDKCIKYARLHGNLNLGPGGATHDVFNVIDKYGIVPECVYDGLKYGTDKHIHGELDATIKAYMDAVIKNPNRTLSTAWHAGLNGILDAYLGEVPETFTYEGKEYTPRQFADMLGIKGSNYQSYSSYTHHPMGELFAVEVPDNWAWDLSMNVPVDEMITIIDKAIENNGSIYWASDVSERGFQYNKGFAILPESNVENMDDSEKAKWSALTEEEQRNATTQFSQPLPEIKVTQENRQEGFDNYQTTDDHGMVIVGIAKDQDGKKFYKVKNSWGEGGIYEGYFYASEAFVKAKTMNFVVRK